MDKFCIEVSAYEYNIIMGCLRDRTKGFVPIAKTSNISKHMANGLMRKLETQFEAQQQTAETV